MGGWEVKELWNFWNLDFMASETEGWVVDDKPWSYEDGTKDFVLETLNRLDVGWLG